MHYLTALKSGVTVERSAISFVKELWQKSSVANELCLQFSADFVNMCLRAIGLECQITPEQIEADCKNYKWPDDRMSTYTFHYNKMEFTPFEQFLVGICLQIEKMHDNHMEQLVGISGNISEIETPLDFFMQLIAIWCNVYKHLKRTEIKKSIKRFDEPLARINFHLMLGIYQLRLIYHASFPLLNNIFIRLFWSALDGLHYQQTHEFILDGFLVQFERSFDLIYQYTPQALNFYYEAFIIDYSPKTHVKLYGSLQKLLVGLKPLLTEGGHLNPKTKVMTSFLIEPHMLEIYYTTLLISRNQSPRQVKYEALKFLDTLQKMLTTLDCFTRYFLEAILNLVLRTEASICNYAAKLYISMMKRKCINDATILHHIVEFYFKHDGTISKLGNFLLQLYKHFQYLGNVNNLLKLASKPNIEENVRIQTSHMVVKMFVIRLKRASIQTDTILQNFMIDLPQEILQMKSNICINILLKIFDFEEVKNWPELAITNFIKFAMNILMCTQNDYEKMLLLNIFIYYRTCLQLTDQWAYLETLKNHLEMQFKQCILQINKMIHSQVIKLHVIAELEGLLKRFNILLKFGGIELDYKYILKHMRKLFFNGEEHRILFSLDTSKVIFEPFKVYAFEIMNLCTLQLHKTDEQNKEFAIQSANQLLTAIWREFEILPKLTMMELKAYFHIITTMYVYSIVELEPMHYCHMVQLLELVVFSSDKWFKNSLININRDSHIDELVEDQKCMLEDIIELHKIQSMPINSYSIWKLCIFYGLNDNKFDDILLELFQTLATNYFNIYKHILPVIVYNLYKRELNNKTLYALIKRHKQMIMTEMRLESPELISVHIILQVLEIIHKSLSIQSINSTINRLSSLRHLEIFVMDGEMRNQNVFQLINKEITIINSYLLTSTERKEVQDFIYKLNELQANDNIPMETDL